MHSDAALQGAAFASPDWRIQPNDDATRPQHDGDSPLALRRHALDTAGPLLDLRALDFKNLPRMRDAAPDASDARLAGFQALGPDLQAIVLNFLDLRERLALLTPAMRLQVRSEPVFAHLVAALERYELNRARIETAQHLGMHARQAIDRGLMLSVTLACIGMVVIGALLMDQCEAASDGWIGGAGIVSLGSAGVLGVAVRCVRPCMVSRLQRQLADARAALEAALLRQARCEPG